MTQAEKIYNHMAQIGPIDQLTALRAYGIMRLASRIDELKKAEIPIEKRMKPVRCGDGTIAHVAEYRLKEPEDMAAVNATLKF